VVVLFDMDLMVDDRMLLELPPLLLIGLDRIAGWEVAMEL
jgi:hypothetical protein